MDEELKAMLGRVAEAIGHSKNWIGRTNREVRDEIEKAAQEISGLRDQIAKSTEATASGLKDLTASINRTARSNTVHSVLMVILTFVLAVATVVLAIAAFKPHESVSKTPEHLSEGLGEIPEKGVST